MLSMPGSCTERLWRGIVVQTRRAMRVLKIETLCSSATKLRTGMTQIETCSMSLLLHNCHGRVRVLDAVVTSAAKNQLFVVAQSTSPHDKVVSFNLSDVLADGLLCAVRCDGVALMLELLPCTTPRPGETNGSHDVFGATAKRTTKLHTWRSMHMLANSFKCALAFSCSVAFISSFILAK